MIRYRKTTVTVSETGPLHLGNLVQINGEIMRVTAVNPSSDTVELQRLTWLGRALRRLTPPYRIGREGSFDRVILRFRRHDGLYVTTYIRSWRFRAAYGSGYTRTLELYRIPEIRHDAWYDFLRR